MVASVAAEPHQDLAELRFCRLHLSFGFRQAERLKKVGYKDGERLDVYLMQLDLEE